MENLFRVVSATELDAALASGAVPRCPADARSNRIHLNFRDDVEMVAGLYFTASEAPLALEIRRTDIGVHWALMPPTVEKPFRQVLLDQPNILLSWIVAVHRLEWVGAQAVLPSGLPMGTRSNSGAGASAAGPLEADRGPDRRSQR